MPNPPEIQYAGSKAYYSPITDRITLPPRELFISADLVPPKFMNVCIRPGAERDSTANRSRRRRRSVLRHTLPKSSLPRWVPLFYALKLEYHPQWSRTKRHTF
jgi:hypothetical protein